MIDGALINNVLRFILLVLAQWLLFQQIGYSWGDRSLLSVLVYPLFIMLLPLRTPATLVVVLGFLAGISVDYFYQTPGLHAAAATFTGFARPLVLRLYEPREGYNLKDSPVKEDLGSTWFLRYSATLLIGHLFFYFMVQAFSHLFIVDVILRTLISFVASWLIVVALVFIFNPKS